MAETKPLSKEQRDRLKKLADPYIKYDPTRMLDELADAFRLLGYVYDAEQFWREAVKNARHDHTEGDCTTCAFCGSDMGCDADCPWHVAQSE